VIVCGGCGVKLRRTLPAAEPLAEPPAATPAAGAPRREHAGETPNGQVTLEQLMTELRELRRLQERMLELLKHPVPAEAPPAFVGEDGAPVPPVRSRKRKTVLLIDDTKSERQAAVAALERADVPVRTATDGSAGIAALAIEKPDVVALELDLKGPMAGKDVINMIKATMEWVDIPIVLYTRQPIASQRDARTIHGADDFILKGEGSAEALVSRVVTLFRKG
jgi:CheY-like chemotaxis protein